MLPLNGVKVLDLSHAAAGPCCTLLLANMGADVIKVEPLSGETFRHTTGGASFVNLNQNKRGIALNLRSREGYEIALKLASNVDVLVENFTPGTIDKLGLGYEVVSQLNSSIIYCSISGFGQTGPYRERPALDPIIQAMSGMMLATGEANGQPVRTASSTIDFGSGMLAAYSIAIALLHKDRTGKGQNIDVSLFDTGIFYMSHFITNYSLTGQVPQRLGSGAVFFSPYQAFDTQDKPCFLCVNSDKAWNDFCRIMGLDALLEDHRYATNADRLINRDELTRVLNPILKQYKSEELMAKLAVADIPCAPLLSVGEIITDPQVVVREIVADADYPGLGNIKVGQMPVKFSEIEPVKLRAPLLGEHTYEILEEIGYGRDEIERFSDKGVIFQHGTSPKN